MPKVSKQSLKRPSRRKTGGVLDAAVPVGEMVEQGMKICLYGRSKTGKTTLACTFPKPLLLVGTEDGTRSVRTFEGVDFLRIRSSDQVDEVVAAVGGKYKSVVLDTAGGLQDMILAEILGLEDAPVEKSWGMAAREQWQSCGVQVKERLRAMLDLADQHGLNAIVIAHERSFNDEGGSDLIFPTVGAALTPSVAGWLNAACDYLCQAFLREQIVVRQVKAGKTTSAVTTRTGRVEYCLRVGPHPVYMTGFRRVYTDGETIPDAVVDPNYDKIKQLIQGV